MTLNISKLEKKQKQTNKKTIPLETCNVYTVFCFTILASDSKNI